LVTANDKLKKNWFFVDHSYSDEYMRCYYRKVEGAADAPAGYNLKGQPAPSQVTTPYKPYQPAITFFGSGEVTNRDQELEEVAARPLLNKGIEPVGQPALRPGASSR
jgi:hypothetical protein